MSTPVTKIARQRLRRDLRGGIFSALAVFLSVFMIALLLFFAQYTQVTENSEREKLPFEEFLLQTELAVNITVILVAIVTLLTLRIHCRMKNEANKQTLALLTSLGATGWHKLKLLLYEILLLYLPPVALGVALGLPTGISLGERFTGVGGAELFSYSADAVMLVAAAFFAVFMCAALPSIEFRRQSLIASVRKHDQRASEERHGYRQSMVYKSQNIISRLSKKCVDYHYASYNRIAVSFALAVLYPVIAWRLFDSIAKTDIVLDFNPFDSVHTSSAVISAAREIFVFLGTICFALTCIGIVQAVVMARIQLERREKTLRVYLTLGMTRADTRKLMRMEIRYVLLKSAVILLFVGLAIRACYEII